MSEDESRQVPLDALPALLPRLNHVTALPPGAAAWVVAERARIALDANELPLVVVAATRDDADRIASELRFHLHDDGTGDADIAVRVLPADDTRTWDGLSPHPELPRQRLAALRAIDEGEPVVVVVPARALLARVLSPESIDELTVSLEIGTVVEPADLVANLVDHGYFNAPLAEEPGTVALRGGVVDVWPAGSPNPVRIEFFDDEIESMASMNAHTGRAREPLDDLLLLPAREAVVTEAALKRANEHTLAVVDERGSGQVRRRKLLGDLKAGLWFPGAEDYLCALHPVVPISDRLTDLGPGRVVVVEGRDADADLDHFDRRWRERWALLSDEDKPLIWPGARFLSPDDLRAVLQNAIQVGALTVAPAGEPHSAGARDNADLAVGKGDLDPVATRLRAWLDDGWRVALAVDSHGRLERLHAVLQPHSPPARSVVSRRALGVGGPARPWLSVRRRSTGRHHSRRAVRRQSPARQAHAEEAERRRSVRRGTGTTQGG
jgi:transcription-repair coupling factor (superfamily II helicase)